MYWGIRYFGCLGLRDVKDRGRIDMRIALMTNNYRPFIGGVPISIERLKRGMEALGHQVTVFAPTYEEQEQEENVFRYATCMNRFIGGIVLPNPFDRRIEEEFRSRRYDIIHVHHPMLIGRTAVYLSKKYDIPLAFTYHTRYEKYVECYTRGFLRVDRVMPLYLRVFLRHCDHVFAPTEGIREYLYRSCHVDMERLSVLPTGIEERNFSVAEAEKEEIREKYLHGCAGDCKERSRREIPLFLTVSRLAQEKNVTFLLESLALFKERYGEPFRMVIVGDGPDRERYERYCSELGIAEEVAFAGMLPNRETAAYYAAADAFLFASKTETQGIVILEAFAGGTPVLAVRASGVEDLVSSGINGVLTEEDTGAFAEAMLDFCKGGLNRREMEENALAAGQQYREEAVARQAVSVYNEVVAARAAGQERIAGLCG